MFWSFKDLRFVFLRLNRIGEGLYLYISKFNFINHNLFEFYWYFCISLLLNMT